MTSTTALAIPNLLVRVAEQLLALWTALVDAWVAWRGGEQDDGIEIELLPDDREMTEAEALEVIKRIMDPNTYNLEVN